MRSVPSSGGPAISYCTHKTTSSGCAPTMGATGTPSATAPSGFLVSAVEVEANKLGILFYGTKGPKAVPFMGGLRCVQGPVVRTPLQSSGSTGAPSCGGVLSLDLNAAGVCARIGEGNPGYVQAWFRDAQSSHGVGLSDALTFTVCP